MRIDLVLVFHLLVSLPLPFSDTSIVQCLHVFTNFISNTSTGRCRGAWDQIKLLKESETHEPREAYDANADEEVTTIVEATSKAQPGLAK